MVATQNRKHSKITKLPKEVRETVNQLLVSGKTIAQILEHLKRLAENGTVAEKDLPSKSGVGRYAKGFLAKLEKMELMREQAKVVVEKAKEDGFVLEEASTNLMLNEITSLLMNDKLGPKDLFFHAMSIAKLNTSSAARERARMHIMKEQQKKTKAAVKEVKKITKGLSPEMVNAINEKILGISV